MDISYAPTSFEFTQAGGLQGINPSPRQLPHGTPTDVPATVIYGQSQFSDVLQSAGNSEFHTTNINIMGTIAPSKEAREVNANYDVKEGDLVIVFNPILTPKNSKNPYRAIMSPHGTTKPDSGPGALIAPQTWQHNGNMLDGKANFWPPALNEILVSRGKKYNDGNSIPRDSTYDRNPSLKETQKRLDSEFRDPCDAIGMIYVVRSFSRVNPAGTVSRAPGNAKISVSIRGRANLRIHPLNLQFLLDIGLYEGQKLCILALSQHGENQSFNNPVTLLVVPEGIDFGLLHAANPGIFVPMFQILKKTHTYITDEKEFAERLMECFISPDKRFKSPVMMLQAAVVPERQVLEVNILRSAYPIGTFQDVV